VGTLDGRASKFGFTRAGMLFDAQQVANANSEETAGLFASSGRKKDGLERNPARFLAVC
jgi:hypothetical protein